MPNGPSVLLVDDNVGDLQGLIDLINYLGYDVELATDEEMARDLLKAVRDGGRSYILALIDVMVAIRDISRLDRDPEGFWDESNDTGIRLCTYARRELKLSAEQLPIACITAREDDAVRQAMEELGIELYPRTADSNRSLRDFLMQHLPRLSPPARTPE